MSQGWENYEPAPLEFFHGVLMDKFHEFRTQKGNADTLVMITGSDLNNLIAKAKMETYRKYPKQVNQSAILKTDI